MGVNGKPHPLGGAWGKSMPGLGGKVGGGGKRGCLPMSVRPVAAGVVALMFVNTFRRGRARGN